MTCNQWSITATWSSNWSSNWRSDKKPPSRSQKGSLSPLPLSCLRISFFSLIWTPTHLTALMNSWSFVSTCGGPVERGEVMKDKEGRWLEGRDKWDPFLVAMKDEEGHGNMTFVLSKCWWLQTHKVCCWAALVFIPQWARTTMRLSDAPHTPGSSGAQRSGMVCWLPNLAGNDF